MFGPDANTVGGVIELEAFARSVAAEHELPCEALLEVAGHGSVNHVYVVGAGLDRWVVRFARDGRRSDAFAVEAWCATAAAAHGVPTPEVVATGMLGGIAYGIQRFVDGRPGDQGDRTGLWPILGAYAAVIARIPVSAAAPDGLFSRFGRDLRRAWTAHLDYNLDQLDDHDPLLAEGAITRSQQLRLRGRIAELRSVPLGFGLSHGDLSPRNLLVASGRPPQLIDWGSASFGPVPLSDLCTLERARRTTGSPTSQEIGHVAEACGWPIDDEHLEILAGFVELTSVDLVRWSMAWRPDLQDGYITALQDVLD
jgi:aminoglycoside phosphotransferase (APT) family kinase protein